jgi:hypothetical protein
MRRSFSSALSGFVRYRITLVTGMVISLLFGQIEPGRWAPGGR